MTAQQIQNTGSGCLSRASSRNGNAKASRELAMNQTYMALTGLLMYRVAANEVCTRHMNAETVIITAVHHTRVRTATVLKRALKEIHALGGDYVQVLLSVQ